MRLGRSQMNFGGKKKKSYRTQDPFIFYLSQSKANKSIARKKLIWTRIIMKFIFSDISSHVSVARIRVNRYTFRIENTKKRGLFVFCCGSIFEMMISVILFFTFVLLQFSCCFIQILSNTISQRIAGPNVMNTICIFLLLVDVFPFQLHGKLVSIEEYQHFRGE